VESILSKCDRITVSHNACFRDAILKINEERSGVALVVDEETRLVGLITDGDIRRAILKGVRLEDSATLAMTKNSITAKHYHTKGELFRIMAQHNVSHIPVVDEEKRPLGIVYRSFLTKENLLTTPVVAMAGGLGTRLRPLTNEFPKPMLKVNGKPMLERIIERFRDLGVIEFYISVNYKAEVIENYFGNGLAWRVQIHYLRETKRLGTAGSLSLLPRDIPCPFFVTNADVMVDLDFRTIYQFHRDNNPDLTVAVKKINYQVPYGTIEVEHDRIVSLSEKPHIKKYVNAGIYVLDPEVLKEIPADEYFDMTDLINKLINNGRKVSSYLIDGTWMDIGQKKDYYRANNIFSKENQDELAEEHEGVFESELWQHSIEAT